MVSSSEDELNLEYWYVAEAHVQGSNKHYTTHRQVGGLIVIEKF